MFLPRNVPHEWDVIGDERGVVLIITAPGGLEEFLHEFHQPKGYLKEIARGRDPAR